MDFDFDSELAFDFGFEFVFDFELNKKTQYYRPRTAVPNINNIVLFDYCPLLVKIVGYGYARASCT